MCFLLFHLAFIVVSLRPGRTVHCIHCFSLTENPSQKSDQNSNKNSGQKSRDHGIWSCWCLQYENRKY